MMVVNNYKYIVIMVVIVTTFVLLPSIPLVRNLLATPLMITDFNAKGDLCYVLAGGSSTWERLDAAADLIQMGRVSRILLMDDNSRGQYSFKAQASWTRTQWATDYLAWRGIPGDRIALIPMTDDLFGTLKEARAVAKSLSKDVKSLVVVSSAPHMRRAMLAFRRSVPEGVQVVPYAATAFEHSYEMYHPIWIEYFKLLVYYVIA